MDYYQIIAGSFQSTIETIAMSVDNLAEPIERASELMTGALLSDCKIIACGNGVDAALAQLFTSNLLSRFEQERPALPALSLAGDSASLTAIAQHSGINDIFSRQLRALGNAGDILLCINSGVVASNLIRAVQAAHERNMGVIVMSNSLDSELGNLISAEDVELRIDGSSQGRTASLHSMAIHCFCELIDHSLFGAHNQE